MENLPIVISIISYQQTLVGLEANLSTPKLVVGWFKSKLREN